MQAYEMILQILCFSKIKKYIRDVSRKIIDIRAFKNQNIGLYCAELFMLTKIKYIDFVLGTLSYQSNII